MRCKFYNRISAFLFAGLCITIFLATSLSIATGQALDTSGPDRAHCVRMGDLYATSPAVNNGKGICQFPDNSWCDGHEFFIGSCSATTFWAYNPYSTAMLKARWISPAHQNLPAQRW